jgi:hypothetical protein
VRRCGSERKGSKSAMSNSERTSSVSACFYSMLPPRSGLASRWCRFLARSNESWTEFGTAVVVATLIGGGGWVSGMVIMAQGQIIQAVVDTTVNTSPLLDNPSKAQFLGVKSDDPPPDRPPLQTVAPGNPRSEQKSTGWRVNGPAPRAAQDQDQSDR